MRPPDTTAPAGERGHLDNPEQPHHTAPRGTCPAFLAWIVKLCDFVILAVLAALAVAAVAEVVGWLP